MTTFESPDGVATGPATAGPPVIATDDSRAQLEAKRADEARTAWLDLSKTVADRAKKAALTGRLFALFPTIVLLVVGAGMIGVAVWDVVVADPSVQGGERAVVVTGTAMSNAEFVAVVIVGAVLLLAAPAALHFSGELARQSTTRQLEPDLQKARDDQGNAERQFHDALARAASDE